MTEHDVERRLVAVLERHAEDAMSQTDTQTLHDVLMIGRQDDPGPGPRRLVATAVAAAAVAAAGVVVLWSAGSGRDASSPDPADAGQTVEAVAVAERSCTRWPTRTPTALELFMASGHAQPRVGRLDGAACAATSRGRSVRPPAVPRRRR